MTAEQLPPWARMSLGYDGDPKVAELVRFGEDAGLCRDLHLAAIRYCRRHDTDGWVPPQEPGRLAWPLPPDRAMALVEHLVEVDLFVPDGAPMAPAKATPIADAMASGMAVGWRVPNYDKWQETHGEREAYSAAQAERGRLGAAKRWKREPARDAAYGGSMANAKRVPDDQAIWHPDGEPMAEREIEGEPSSSVSDPRARGRAGERASQHDDEDQLPNTIVAMLSAHGPITRIQAVVYRDNLLAGRRVEDPAKYVIGAIRRDPKGAYREAITAAPRSTAGQQPPPAGMRCRRCGLTGHRDAQCDKPPPDDDSAKHGAAEARQLLADKLGATTIADEDSGPVPDQQDSDEAYEVPF